MKISEAIKLLQMQDPNADLVIISNNMEYSGELVPVNSLNPMKGDTSEKICRDAFDGTTYTKEVIRLSPQGSKLIVIVS